MMQKEETADKTSSLNIAGEVKAKNQCIQQQQQAAEGNLLGGFVVLFCWFVGFFCSIYSIFSIPV